MERFKSNNRKDFLISFTERSYESPHKSNFDVWYSWLRLNQIFYIPNVVITITSNCQRLHNDHTLWRGDFSELFQIIKDSFSTARAKLFSNGICHRRQNSSFHHRFSRVHSDFRELLQNNPREKNRPKTGLWNNHLLARNLYHLLNGNYRFRVLKHRSILEIDSSDKNLGMDEWMGSMKYRKVGRKEDEQHKSMFQLISNKVQWPKMWNLEE